MSAIIDQFHQLPLPQEGAGERFSVRQIGQHSCVIGKDSSGRPALLIETQTTTDRDRPAPIVLERVRVQHDLDCSVYHTDGTEAINRYTMILCTDSDSQMHEYFLRTVSSVVLALDNVPSRADVVQAINTLVELFRSIGQAPRKSVQGLWAELFVLAQAPNVRSVIASWHNMPEDRYDFNLGSQRIEVKSASGRVRSHHFSLEQIRPPVGTRVLVASVFVEPASGGTSVIELFEEVRSQVADDATLLLHLDRVLRLSLGSAWRQGVEERFDRQLSVGSLRYYQALDVPAVNHPLPPEVSEVHFRVNIMHIQPIDIEAVVTEGGLFEATLQR